MDIVSILDDFDCAEVCSGFEVENLLSELV